MKKTLTILSLFVSFFSYSQENGYKLVWSDEFDAASLNKEYWNIEVNDYGGGNNELQYYTDRAENIRLSDGNLIIEARKENYLTRNYTSGRITTQKKFHFTYGKVEARIKLPYGKGIWPAFWMLGESISSVGWPNCGEIDIMEMIGGDTNDAITHFTLHWGPYSNGSHPMYGTSYTLPSGILADDYHVFSVEWTDKKIMGFIDNIKYFEMYTTDAGLAAFHKDFFIILNLAVGGNWPGNPDASTVFPQLMYVDYVRVYQMSTNIESMEKKSEYMIYPNPAMDYIVVKSADELQCSVITVDGRVLNSKNFNLFNNIIDISNYSPGIYFLEIKDKKGCVSIEKFIIQ